jgi:hypothetical protein
MKKLLYIPITAMLLTVSCTDLTEKMYSDMNKNNFYTTVQEYESAFINQYTFLRQMYCWNGYYLQELTTDEACLPQKGRDGYDGGRYQRLHWHTWTSQDDIIYDAWLELYRAIGFCNQILADLNDANDILPATKRNLFIAETRAVRAFYYSRLLDLFGNVPVVTTTAEVNPPTKPRNEVFQFVEAEILQVKDALLRHGSAESYGRFTQESALALLSRLYLNAEVYTGTPRWSDCIEVSKQLIPQFKLEDQWDAPFVWDNEKSTENIFVIPNDEILAADMSPIFYRTMHWSLTSPQWNWRNQGGWNAICTVREFIETYDTINDIRCKYDPMNGQYGQFMWGPQYDLDGNPINGTNEFAGQHLNLTLDVADMINNAENAGARNIKYKVKIGAYGLANDFVVFRLAEIIFNLAEAGLRSSGSVDPLAMAGLNKIRTRAGVGTYSAITLDELYDEKGREMCYEVLRRTDMVRFGTFIAPMWDKNHTDDAKINLFPIPYFALNANPNLKPNYN